MHMAKSNQVFMHNFDESWWQKTQLTIGILWISLENKLCNAIFGAPFSDRKLKQAIIGGMDWAKTEDNGTILALRI